jgi:phosphopantetheine adenylyltransferase
MAQGWRNNGGYLVYVWTEVEGGRTMYHGMTRKAMTKLLQNSNSMDDGGLTAYMVRLLRKYGAQEAIRPYTSRTEVVHRILNEIKDENAEVCCTLEVPASDLSFWMQLLYESQEDNADLLRFTNEHTDFYLTGVKVGAEVLNQLLADVTLQFRDDSTIANYSLRLRWLETTYLFSALELHKQRSQDDGQHETVTTCERYLRKIQEQVDVELLDCIYACHTATTLERVGKNLPTPTVYSHFTPETLLTWMGEEHTFC